MIDLFEVRRKLFHVMGGVLIFTGVLLGYLTPGMLVMSLFAILLSSWIIFSTQQPILLALIRLFEREKNMKRFPLKGLFFFVLGCTLPLFLFPFKTALLSIIILTVGDAASALIGKYFGRTRHPFHSSKKIEGHIAGGLLAFLCATLFNDWYLAGYAWWQLLFVCMLTMFLEGVEHVGRQEWFDDNLTIPLFSGLLLLAMRYI